MRARVPVVLVLFLAAFAATAPASDAVSLRKFTYRATGTNKVNIATGELSEHWKGTSPQLGKITTRVAGFIQRPTPTTLTVKAAMIIVDPGDDVLVATCTGSGTLPIPDGAEDWTCRVVGGSGKFRRSRGQWKLHIDIHRISNQNAVQKNRFDETGSGKVSWSSRRS